MTKTIEESKKQTSLIKEGLLATKKTGKAGIKSGKNRGKKPAAGRTKAKGGKKGAKGGKKGAGGKNAKANKNSGDSKEKEESSSKEKDKEEPCKSIFDNLTSCHPSNPESCKCGTSMDYTVASIPRSVD